MGQQKLSGYARKSPRQGKEVAPAPTTAIQRCIQAFDPRRPGDLDELLSVSYERMIVMIRSMMTRYPHLRRWEQSDDVLANVHLRLLRCFAQVTITSAQHFLALAATNMRRELIDLSRHHYGDSGPGRTHATPDRGAGDDLMSGVVSHDRDPALLAEWSELHEHVARLPDDEREVVDLHWYHGLDQQEVAALLCVSLRTVKRRWLAAKDRLATSVGRGPGSA